MHALAAVPRNYLTNLWKLRDSKRRASFLRSRRWEDHSRVPLLARVELSRTLQLRQCLYHKHEYLSTLHCALQINRIRPLRVLARYLADRSILIYENCFPWRSCGVSLSSFLFTVPFFFFVGYFRESISVAPGRFRSLRRSRAVNQRLTTSRYRF